MINLNFSNIGIDEALSILSSHNEKWIQEYHDFLFNYSKQEKFNVKTSGTTGKRKTIIVSKLQMKQSATSTLNYFNLREGNSTLLTLSCDFIAGKMMLVRAIEGKLNLFLAKPTSDPSNYFSREYDFVPLVPMQVESIIKSKKLNQIRNLLIGGGKLSKDIIQSIQQFNIKAYESFATTETLTHFALKRICPDFNEWFKTINGFEIDKNEKGELVIKKNFITNCELITNDLIEKKSDSEFKWLGRSDNVINSGGIKLIPEEIENKISELIPSEFVLIGMPDEKLGERIALVSKKPLRITLDEINAVLSRYEKIRVSYVVKRFPLTSSGKIKRKELQKMLNA